MTHIAILSAGEMGAAIGAALTAEGHAVATCLEGRGGETRDRAAEAGLRDVPLEDLVTGCDLFLSILPPADALGLATQVAGIAGRSGAAFAYVDCNAISPETAAAVAACFEETAVTFVDAGVVGMPPSGGRRPRLYVSGPDVPALRRLDGVAVDLRPLGEDIGKASALKMSYASITKGVNALLLAAFQTAEAHELLDDLAEELGQSQPELFSRAESSIPSLPADAGRWVAEMRQIAETYARAGQPAGFHDAAAEVMERLATSPYGAETRRTRDRSRDMRATIRGLKDV
ncbi:DUF1932 domain-containing protein [Roseicyclus sp. F158]|uniref:DUF1932 domain-containing protein n=1 Tax=Tropicimonas omnivorans TaxID=3075590 RepID=A0ABU3DCA7_9RHOB|nr:DUF1932 domain-containing protein [Roseicyclus sp. F158]MDT0681333.1 DUF1932 domain-containing protein [Roseicyclus sp. F158]